MNERVFRRMQYGMVTLIAVLFGLSFLLAPHHGLLRIISTDDGFYQAHVRAALLGRTDEVRNGMTAGTPPAQGAAPARLEYVVGTLFLWTPLKAPQVLMLLTILLTPWIVVLLTQLLLTIFKDRRIALIGSGMYVLVFLSTLQKPVNMSLSLPLTVLALLLLAVNRERPRHWLTILNGLLLGLMTGTYFWSWTFVWAVALWLVILDALNRKPSRVFALSGSVVIAMLWDIPAALHFLRVHNDPIFIQTTLRSTLVHTHAVESIPRAALLLALIALSLLLLRQSRRTAKLWIFPFALLFAAFCCMFQNVVHGILLTFSSHYYPFVCLAALGIGLWAYLEGKKGFLRFGVMLCASVFLIAGLYDYRSAWDIIAGKYYVRGIDHLAPATTILDDGTRETVLTDRTTAHMITTWTDDDVLFTAYAKHLIMSDEEYAQRYCLTEIFTPAGADSAWLARETMERPDAAEFVRREAQFSGICKTVRADAQKYLTQFGVTKLLWNETLRPEWKIDPKLFRKTRQGEGWSLWEATTKAGTIRP